MKASLKLLIILTAVQTLTGCGSLNTVKYHKASVKPDIKTEKSGDGIAIAVDEACLYVQSYKSVYPRAFTLVGVPVFPISFSTPEPSNAGYFDMSLWIIPEYRNTDYLFDVTQIELEFDDDVRVPPESVQVSRFTTSIEKIPDLLFPHVTVREHISQADHWKDKPLSAFQKPVEIWPWTRFNASFKKSVKTLNPARLYVRGLLRNGVVQDIPAINFSFVSELRQAFPGRWADGTWIGHGADNACRKLQDFKEDVLRE